MTIQFYKTSTMEHVFQASAVQNGVTAGNYHTDFFPSLLPHLQSSLSFSVFLCSKRLKRRKRLEKHNFTHSCHLLGVPDLKQVIESLKRRGFESCLLCFRGRDYPFVSILHVHRVVFSPA